MSIKDDVIGDVEVLAVVTLGGYFSSEELGDIDIEPRMSALEQVQQDVISSDSDEHLELVDRAHVTRLTAERDELLAEVEVLKSNLDCQFVMADNAIAEIDVLQSELTKALECISEAGVLLASRWIMPEDLSAWRKSASECLAHQSAPAAKTK